MDNKQKSDQPKYFDVMPPGRTTPSSTSRPIIVGNHPEQDDPMINRPNSESYSEEKAPEDVQTAPKDSANESPGVSSDETVEGDTEPSDSSSDEGAADDNTESVDTDDNEAVDNSSSEPADEQTAPADSAASSEDDAEDVTISDESQPPSTDEQVEKPGDQPPENADSPAGEANASNGPASETPVQEEDELLLPEHATPDSPTTAEAVVSQHQPAPAKPKRWPRVLLTVVIFLILLTIAYYVLNR